MDLAPSLQSTLRGPCSDTLDFDMEVEENLASSIHKFPQKNHAYADVRWGDKEWLKKVRERRGGKQEIRARQAASWTCTIQVDSLWVARYHYSATAVFRGIALFTVPGAILE